MNQFAEKVEPRAIDPAQVFHHRHVPAAGLFFCAEAEVAKDARLPQGLFSRVICRGDPAMMNKHKQLVAFVAQAARCFRRLRLIIQRTVVPCVAEYC
jgi:hypothetical protein